MHRLSASDLEGVLRFIHDAGVEPGPEAFPAHVVDQLRVLLRCEWGSYCELDRRGERVLALVEAPVPDDEVSDETFWRIIRAHPLCQAQLRGRFDALKLSDFHARRSLHRTGLYADCFRPAGVEYELELALPSRIEHTKTFLFDDSRHDFGDRERALLNLLQPHLVQLDRNADLRRRAAAVRKHLENFYDKLGVHTRTAAAAYLQRQDRV